MTYSYVAENISTIVLDAPIEETFSEKLQYLKDTQDFYMELEDLDPKFNDYLMGDICPIYWESGFGTLCYDFADAAANRGFLGMNGYLLNAIEEAKSAFYYSDRTFEDQKKALQAENVIQSERMFGVHQ